MPDDNGPTLNFLIARYKMDYDRQPINRVPQSSTLFVTDQLIDDERPRLWSGINLATSSFIVLLLIETALTVAFTLYKMFWWKHSDSTTVDYGILMLVSAGFVVYLAVEGVLTENKFGLVAFVASSCILLFFSTFAFFWVDQERHIDPLLWAREAYLLVVTLLNFLLSLWVYRHFGWRVFRKIGADPLLISMYKSYQIFTSLLKLDLMVGVLGVLLVGLFLPTNWELWMLIGAEVLTAVWALFGWVCVRNEWKPAMILFFALAVFEPGYIVGKMLSIFVLNADHYRDESHARLVWVWPMVALSAVAVLVRTLLIIWSVRVTRNFGHGLRERVFARD